jgi:NAD(P)-dependent dehydrogenase (short-subunit alcohol dehydrogenase family)
MARHLAEAHGARHLLLISRSGEAADGAAELGGQLRALGCDVRIEACDVADRSALAKLIASIPSEHPLVTVIHAAGVMDDGVVSSLDPQRMERVMAPKVDGAINLHELTEDLRLEDFILFSSVAATAGSAGQGNYAAANAFLDALAHHRRARGLPALSLGWGARQWATGMTAALGEADRARLERQGIAPLSDSQITALFDVSRSAGRPALLPMRLDIPALSAQGRAGELPQIMRSLIRTHARWVEDEGAELARLLAQAPTSEWDTVVRDMVRGHVAGVLGQVSAHAIDPSRPFQELGFDSLSAIELRNRLGQATGMRLPATLVFDHPSPAAVAELLRSKVAEDGATRPGGSTRPAFDEELDRLTALLPSIADDDGERQRLEARLRRLLVELAGEGDVDGATVTVETIQSASASEIVALIDQELGGA